mmetsp:Transcript_7431/g.16226  ORF Transcript_7431/g.16226 Transcript_7431/m.16226 type:complete len:244 (-) Transcript_7431:457-1188(-)
MTMLLRKEWVHHSVHVLNMETQPESTMSNVTISIQKPKSILKTIRAIYQTSGSLFLIVAAYTTDLSSFHFQHNFLPQLQQILLRHMRFQFQHPQPLRATYHIRHVLDLFIRRPMIRIVHPHHHLGHIPSPIHSMKERHGRARDAISPIDEVHIERFHFRGQRSNLIIVRYLSQGGVVGISPQARLADVGKVESKMIVAEYAIAGVGDPGGIGIDSRVARDADVGGNVGGFTEAEFEDGFGVVV